MKSIQFDKIVEFTFIFLSGDMDIIRTSPDYILEKYDKYIGVSAKISSKKSVYYNKHSEIFGDNETVKSIFLYFEAITKLCQNKDIPLLKIKPNELLNIFKKYIGDYEKIPLINYSFVHPLIREDMINEYLKMNERWYKFKILLG